MEPAIRDLSFSIEAGEKIAVVGRTGAGKSSFFQLLQGFREPCEGMIMVDGNDLKKCSKKNLRSSINVVLQNPYINENATIKSNLLGIEEASGSSTTFTDQQLQQILH